MHIETNLPTTVNVDQQLDAIAKRYKAAGGVGIHVLNLLGAQADGLIERLPATVRRNLDAATEKALKQAMRAASSSRSMVGDQPSWLNQAATMATGAAGGAGGLPSALAELPVTTTLLLRVIQGVAAEYGFDPKAENVQFDCIKVFSAAGPLKGDDGADLGFLSARLALSGQAVQSIIAKVAPRLAVVMGQKLAAQAVPILGAVAGAATNYAYTSYYEDMAHVHFALRKLAIEGDISAEDLTERLRLKMASPAKG
ncbi:MAG: EcsC family protein [Sulfitobacter sp.]